MARAWDKNKKWVVPDGPMEPMPFRTTEILNPEGYIFSETKIIDANSGTNGNLDDSG